MLIKTNQVSRMLALTHNLSPAGLYCQWYMY